MDLDGYKSTTGTYKWFENETDDVILKEDQLWYKISDNKDLFFYEANRNSKGIPDLLEEEISNDVITKYEPNIAGHIEEILNKPSDNLAETGLKTIGKVAYKMADDAFIYGTNLIYGPSKAMHLSGNQATRGEILEGGTNTITNLAPISKVGGLLGVGKKSLNAAQFSKAFKGQEVLRLTPKLRGQCIRQYNFNVSTNKGIGFAKFSSSTAATVGGVLFIKKEDEQY